MRPFNRKHSASDGKKNEHSSWMWLSFALMGLLIATGLTIPQASGATLTLADVFNLLAKIEALTEVIQAKTDHLPLDPAGASLVQTRSSQASVNDLQKMVSAVREKTDTIPKNVATRNFVNASIVDAKAEINAHTDAEIANVTTKITNVDMVSGIPYYIIKSDNSYLLIVCGVNTDLLDKKLSIDRISKNDSNNVNASTIIFTYLSTNKSECLTVSNTDPINTKYQVNKTGSISGMITVVATGNSGSKITISQGESEEAGAYAGPSNNSSQNGDEDKGGSSQLKISLPGIPIVRIP